MEITKYLKKIIYMTNVIMIFFTSLCLAAPFAPGCVCEITAEVVSAEEFTDMNFPNKKYTVVNLDMKIIHVGPQVRSGDMNCDQYKAGQELNVILYKEIHFIDKSSVLKPKMVIKGNIERQGDERGITYKFDKVEIIESEPSKDNWGSY